MKETWKEQYCKKFGLCENQPKYSKCTCSKELKFISKEIIEKIIDDIPDLYGAIDNTSEPPGKWLKQQLKDEWLK